MDTAYANIGLDANTIWRDAPGDGFQKSSDKLWVKLNYLKEKKHHQWNPTLLSGFQPWLADKRMLLRETFTSPLQGPATLTFSNVGLPRDISSSSVRVHIGENAQIMKAGTEASAEEPWMMAEVEQEFRRLTRNCSQPYDLYNGFKPVDCVEVEESIQKKYPVLAKKCQPHTNDTEETLEAIYLPNPFYRIEDLNQLELQMRITSTKHIWEHPLRNLMSLISTDKYSEQLRYPAFPEVDYSPERSGQHQVFPLPFPSQSPPSQNPLVSSFRLMESLGDMGVKRSLKTSSRTSGMGESKADLLPLVKKKSSTEHHHDFTNLTLLTRPISRHESCVPEHSAFQVPETVLKWLQTGYPTRSKEFTAIQNLSDELRNVRTNLQGTAVSNSVRDKIADENFGVKKLECSPGTNLGSNLESSVYRGENLSGSLSSSSSSEPNRSRLGSSNTKLQVSSGSLASSWQTHPSSLWSSKPFNFLGLTPSELSSSRDNVLQRLAGGKPWKCRPILSSQYKEGAEEELGFEEGGEKKRLIRGMADMRAFQCYGENSLDDLERQAIEQWPSEDRMDVFCPKHLQKHEICHYESGQLIVAKTNVIAKRKSAVQILQETKAFYVKSETVLDKKQEFRPGKVPVSEQSYRNFSQSDAQKENRLEDKLRILLDFDSFEGGDAQKWGRDGDVLGGRSFEKATCFQHKSLPDLSIPGGRSSSESSDSRFDLKCDGDSRSAYSSRTQSETGTFFPKKCADCRRSTRSTRDYCAAEFRARPKIFSSFRATKSGEFVGTKTLDGEFSQRRRASNTSSCNRSRHNSSSKHSQSADSGRQSQGGSIGLRTGRSGLPEFSPPHPPAGSWTDSGTEDDSPPLLRSDPCEPAPPKRPILRSKSDISYKFCAMRASMSGTGVRHCLPTSEELEVFFDHLGMDPSEYRELASNSRSSSPVFFSSVSSIDSCVELTGWSVAEPLKASECPSIVERNARIIKWLYNCRKFQKAVVGETKVAAV